MNEQMKVVNAMVSNINSNLEAYAKSLVPEILEKAKEEAAPVQAEQPKQADQLSVLVDSMKALKAMQESMTHGS